MTVAELIQILQKHDPNIEVQYTYDSTLNPIFPQDVCLEDEVNWEDGRNLVKTGRKILVIG